MFYTKITVQIKNLQLKSVKSIRKANMLNKQLERELQTNIQSLRAPQLANVFAHFQKAIAPTLLKTIVTKEGMNYKCEIHLGEKTKVRGFGRNQQEATCNASKNLFSKLIGENNYVEEIKKALKFRKLSVKNDKINANAQIVGQSRFTIDDISMIHPSKDCQEANQYEEECQEYQPNLKKVIQKQALIKPIQNNQEVQETPKDKKHDKKCDCIFYQMNRYQQNQIKHLQARINLLSQENTLLKKVLLCNPKNYKKQASLIDDSRIDSHGNEESILKSQHKLRDKAKNVQQRNKQNEEYWSNQNCQGSRLF